jgi:hypothetical protein
MSIRQPFTSDIPEARMVRALGKAAGLLLAGLSLAGAAGPALAHRASPKADSKYYLSTVTSVQPAVPGLYLRIDRDGWVTLSNSGDQQVTVIGYAGEDYLRIGPNGAEENTAALSSAINTRSGLDMLPADATANATHQPAHWVMRNARPWFTWRDYRVEWTGKDRPSIVARDPHGQHQVFTWALQLRSGRTPVQVLGQVRWIGAPWLETGQIVSLAVLSALIGLAAWFAWLRRRNRRRRASGRARAGSRRTRLSDPGQPSRPLRTLKG